MPILAKKSGSIFDWHAFGSSVDPTTFNFELWIPANASIGIYALTTGMIDAELNSFRHIWSLFKVYVLFNPWGICEIFYHRFKVHLRNLISSLSYKTLVFTADDQTYMPLPGAPEEYVLNENGVIFTGSETEPSKVFWNYNLFDFETLNITFYILQKAALTPVQMASPIEVSRIFSKIVNAPFLLFVHSI
jgi:hypothetical protein